MGDIHKQNRRVNKSWSDIRKNTNNKKETVGTVKAELLGRFV